MHRYFKQTRYPESDTERGKWQVGQATGKRMVIEEQATQKQENGDKEKNSFVEIVQDHKNVTFKLKCTSISRLCLVLFSRDVYWRRKLL